MPLPAEVPADQAISVTPSGTWVLPPPLMPAPAVDQASWDKMRAQDPNTHPALPVMPGYPKGSGALTPLQTPYWLKDVPARKYLPRYPR